LEPLLRLLVTGIAIRVVLERHLPVGALQIFLAAIALDLQHLVKIPRERCHTHCAYTGVGTPVPSIQRRVANANVPRSPSGGRGPSNPGGEPGAASAHPLPSPRPASTASSRRG